MANTNNQQVNIPINIEVESVETSLNKIRQGIQEMNGGLKKASDIDFDNVETLEDLFNKANDEAQKMLILFGRNSEQFKTATENAGKLRREVEAYDKVVDNMKMTGIQRFIGFAQTGLTGIMALQGAMNAFGIESENAEQAIAKLQGVMAFSQALGEIKQLTTSFGLFTTGIIATNASLAGSDKTLKLYSDRVKELTASLKAQETVISKTPDWVKGFTESFDKYLKMFDLTGDTIEMTKEQATVAAFAIDEISRKSGKSIDEVKDAVLKYKEEQDNLKKTQEELKVATKAQTEAQEAQTVATQGTTKATNGLKTALVSLGIGALIVGLGLLIANWDKVSDAIIGVNKNTKNFYEINKQANESIAKQVVQFNLLKESLQKLKTQKDIDNLTTTQANTITKNYNQTLGVMYGEVKNVTDAIKGFNKYADDYIVKVYKMAQATAAFDKIVSLMKDRMELELKKDKPIGVWESILEDPFGPFAGRSVADAGKIRNKGIDEEIEKIDEEIKAITEKYKSELESMYMPDPSKGAGVTGTGRTGRTGRTEGPLKQQKNYLDELKRFYEQILKTRQDFAFKLDNQFKSERDVEVAEEKKRYAESLATLYEYQKLYNEALKNDKANAEEYKKLILISEDEVKQNEQALAQIDKKWAEIIGNFISENTPGILNEFQVQIDEMNASIDNMLKNANEEEIEQLEAFRIFYSNHIKGIENLTKVMLKKQHEANMSMFDLEELELRGSLINELQFGQLNSFIQRKVELKTTALEKERDARLASIKLENLDEKERKRRLLELEEWYNNEKLKIDTEATNSRKQLALSEYEVRREIADNLIDTMGNMGEVLSESAAQQKAVSIAMATIQGIAGVVATLTAPSLASAGPAGWVLAATKAAAIASSTALQIKQIADTKIPGASSSSGDVTPLSLPGSVMNPLSANGIQDVRVLNEKDVVVRNTITDRELEDARNRSDFQRSQSSF